MTLDKEFMNIIVSEYKLGISINKLSIKYDVSTGTIYNRLLKEGIRIRPKTEQQAGQTPSKETVQKMIASKLGKIYPKQSECKLGDKNPMFGTHGNSGSFKKGERRSIDTEFKRLESTPLHIAILSLNKMTEWKALIKDWDNYTCQHCGKYGGVLNSHHIKRVSDIRIEYNLKTIEEALLCEPLWDIGNGITYCESCHKLLKNKGGLLWQELGLGCIIMLQNMFHLQRCGFQMHFPLKNVKESSLMNS
jgi:hypothetical protein